ncbi:MAG: hypothetical protein A2498_05060 [Lentisphaerae bacterium RIFOXYC12_FULL_60_16]|nr:MAG: hypothetical protein A2498_05060 [Lentisphaerae bacterium RIFOXYC12_FULL_60_16]OGV86146.1 MAG: hypothetical protein A2340_02500 [Lentisphaerae bacterium RIFOXYB12_FULL_60_10]
MIQPERSGIALVTVMMMTAILAILVTALLRTSSTQLRVSTGQFNIERATFVAEAGVERAAAHIAASGAIPISLYGTIGGGTYVTAIIQGGSISRGLCSIGGEININPNNSPQNEFTVTLPDNSTITRDDLHQDYAGYTGQAVTVHVKPKGNGNQNSMLVNGNPYPVSNAYTYDILSSTMSINIYNDNINGSGKAVGKWWIAIAATSATLVEGQ